MFEDLFYAGVVKGGRCVTLAQGLRMHTSGEENIPATGGAVLAINHTGYMDFIFGAFLPYRRRRLVRFMAKKAIFDAKPVGFLMRAMGHIPVDRIDGSASFDAAVAAVRNGKIVGVFPEATISRSFEIKRLRAGAVRIAQAAGVPIVPVIVFGSQRIWTKGGKRNLGRSRTPIYIRALEPIDVSPDADAQEETLRLREVMQAGLEELWDAYRRDYGDFPRGEAWVPARFGGGAPDPEVIRAEDDAVDRERHRIRQLTEDLSELSARVKELSRNLVAGVYSAYDSARERLGRDGSKGSPGAATVAQAPDPSVTGRSAADVDGSQGGGGRPAARSAGEEARALFDWVRDGIEELTSEAAAGVKEGRDRIAKGIDQLREDTAGLYHQLAAESAERYQGSRVEEAFTRLAVQARLILQRLPQRSGLHDMAWPTAVVVNADRTLPAGNEALGEREAAAFRQLGVPVIVTTEYSPEEVRSLCAAIDVPTAAVCFDGAVIACPAVGRVTGAIGGVDSAGHADVVERMGPVGHMPGVGHADAADCTEVVAAFGDSLAEDIDAAVAAEGHEITWRTHGGPRVFGRIAETTAPVAERLAKALEGRATVTYSRGRIHLTPAGVDRGTTVALLLGEKAAGALAFGDGCCDIAVTTTVGRSVALASAEAELVRVSTDIAPAAEDHGLAQVIEGIIAAHSDERDAPQG